MELLKFKFYLTWSCQNDSGYIFNAKKFRIQETPNLSTDADRSPNTKTFLRGRSTYGHTEVWTKGRTYGRTKGRGRHISHVKISPVTCQCSAIQFNPPV